MIIKSSLKRRFYSFREKEMKKNLRAFFLIFFGVIFIAISVLFFLNIYLGIKIDFEHVNINIRRNDERNEEKKSNIEKEGFILNEEINIFCPLQFNEGFFSTENLAKFCRNENFPQEIFKANIIDFISLDGDIEIGLIDYVVGEEKNEFKLVGVSKDEGYFSGIKIEGRPSQIEKENDLIVVLLEGQEEKKEYRVIEKRIEDFSSKYVQFGNAEKGFFISIPENWDFKINENVFSFFHPSAKENHVIDLLVEEKNGAFSFKFVSEKDSPYAKEYENIKKSFLVNEIKYLPDYRFFKEQLEDYLYVNTVTKEIFYFNEEETKSFNVLASGDYKSWSGTPMGLYSISSKEGLRFSNISAVYMPFSTRIYGKYLIHGEPYFSSGAPYYGRVSGGCVRVRNNEMREIYNAVDFNFPVLMVTHEKEEFPLKKENFLSFPKLTAQNILVADLDSGKVFKDKNPNERRFVNSISKIMTGLIASEKRSILDPVIISSRMIDSKRKTPGIYPGRRVRIVDLIYPLMAETSRSAALALAYYMHEEMMTVYLKEKAESIGMENTHFVDIVKYKEGTFSTAKDIYYLFYYIANTKKPLLKISKGEYVEYINYRVFPDIENRNLFFRESNFIGGNTDYTKETGHSGFFLFELSLGSEKRRIIFIIMGVDSREALREEVLEIKKWIEDYYS